MITPSLIPVLFAPSPSQTSFTLPSNVMKEFGFVQFYNRVFESCDSFVLVSISSGTKLVGKIHAIEIKEITTMIKKKIVQKQQRVLLS